MQRTATYMPISHAHAPFRSLQQRVHLLQAQHRAVFTSSGNGKLIHRDSNSNLEVRYYRAKELPLDEVAELLEKVGWPARQRRRMQTAVQNSYYTAKLEASNQTEDTWLIGMARVVSDGAFNAQIWDVVIDPAYQGIGLGRTMVGEVVRHLADAGISNITTFAENKGTRFYEKLGFQRDPDGVRGMFWMDKQ